MSLCSKVFRKRQFMFWWSDQAFHQLRVEEAQANEVFSEGRWFPTGPCAPYCVWILQWFSPPLKCLWRDCKPKDKLFIPIEGYGTIATFKKSSEFYIQELRRWKVILEFPRFTAWMHQFLRSLEKLRAEGHDVIQSDETWHDNTTPV